MADARYISVDTSWWDASRHGGPMPSELLNALSRDGWESAASGTTHLLVRSFETDDEFNAALAQARTIVGRYLVEEHKPGPS